MPQFFATTELFRAWLRKNHAKERELVVGFYRKDSGKQSITWQESVEEALCFGWIDGVRHKHDELSYTIRFTPRHPNSIWSQINLATMERLIKEGRTAPAGMNVYEARSADKTLRYSFERSGAAFTPAQESQFRSNAKAWAFFEAQVPSYKKPATWWVLSAKQEATREKRLNTLIECSAKGAKIPQMRRPADKS